MVKITSNCSIDFYMFESAEELDSLLTEFNQLVREKAYNKMDYSNWRKLSALSKKEGSSIYCEYNADTEKISIYTGATNIAPLVFDIRDESFGEFIYYTANVLAKKEDNKSMNLSDCGLSYPTKVNSTIADAVDAAKIAAASTSAESAKTHYSLNVTPSYLHDVDYYSGTVSGCITNAIDSICSGNSSYSLNMNDVSELEDRVEKLVIHVNENGNQNVISSKEIKSGINNKKENEKMKGFNFDFGPVVSDKIRMSIYGIAIKNQANTYVSFNPQSQEIIDVDILNFEGKQFLYKMPVAIAAIQAGDVVVHNRKPMFVEVVNATDITVVDVFEGERKNIMPTKSPFGFNFMTKVVSIMDMMNGGNAPSMENPFGNMLPFLMLDQKGENEDDFNPIMMMLMMNQPVTANNMNVMLPLLLSRKNSQMDINMLFMMTAMNGGMGTMMNGALTPSNSQSTEK